MSDALPAAPVPSPERLKELYEITERRTLQRGSDDHRMDIIGVTRGECYAGLAPGMELEVDFENMERLRAVVTVVRGLDTGLHVALVPCGKQDPNFNFSTRPDHVIERIYPAVEESPRTPEGRLTLIDLRGDIVGLRPAPDVDHSAWITEEWRRRRSVWEAMLAAANGAEAQPGSPSQTEDADTGA